MQSRNHNLDSQGKHSELNSFYLNNPYSKKRLKINHNTNDFVVCHSLAGMRDWDYGNLKRIYEDSKRRTCSDIFVDIGANIGTDSLLAAETFELCFCFEALTSNYKILKRNLIENNICHVAINKAVNLQTGEQLLITEPPASNSGSAKIFIPAPDKPAQEKVEKIKSIRADEALQGMTVGFIHIDTEGFDLICLESCKGLLNARPENPRQRPYIRIEYNPTLIHSQKSNTEILFKFLEDYKYTPHMLTQGGHLARINSKALKLITTDWLDQPGDPWVDLLLLPD